MIVDLGTLPPRTPAAPEGEPRDPLALSGREWAVVAAGVLGLVLLMPSLHLRNREVAVEPDYRIPYSLSHRYNLYQRFTDLIARQYPGVVVGDSVVWGQCAERADTLAHHLNLREGRQYFANAGLDAMHPVALEGLLEYHAPALVDMDVLIQFNPLWMMDAREAHGRSKDPLRNRPNLLPRLGADLTNERTLAVERFWEALLRSRGIAPLGARISGSQIDYLRWSLGHPYESPLGVLTSALPPSDDTFSPRLEPWTGDGGSSRIDCVWPDPRGQEMWESFARTIAFLRARGNRVFVLVGPLNEHMLSAAAVRSYRDYTVAVARELRSRGVEFSAPAVLASDHYADICHPLGAGYAELVQKLWEDDGFLKFRGPRSR